MTEYNNPVAPPSPEGCPIAAFRAQAARFLLDNHYLDSEEMQDAILTFVTEPNFVKRICGIVAADFSEELHRNLVKEDGHLFCSESFLPEYAEEIRKMDFPLNRRIWNLVEIRVWEYFLLSDLEYIHSCVLDEVNAVAPKHKLIGKKLGEDE